MRSATRTSLVLAAALAVMLLLLCCTLVTCGRLFTNSSKPTGNTREQERKETEDSAGVRIDDIDKDAPPGVTGEVVRVPLNIPTEIPTGEAVLINTDKDNLPKTDDGKEVAVYLYDDPAEEELNLIVESERIATEVWWQGSDREWCPSPSAFSLTEEGEDIENIEFLMPKDTTDWGREITIGFSPVR